MKNGMISGYKCEDCMYTEMYSCCFKINSAPLPTNLGSRDRCDWRAQGTAELTEST